MLWDIFCKVIDNHGDIGVCWRLSAQLAERGERVRLWVDDASALRWMAPEGDAGVEVRDWAAQAGPVAPGDVVIEAFGCELEPSFQSAVAAASHTRGRQPPWVNLEYLTAESFAGRSHGLPSPVLAGPAAGLTKHFFYPGFTPATGGLLRERDLAERQARFDRAGWLRGHGIPLDGARLASMFCYEPPAMAQLLGRLAAGPSRTRLLVAAGRATEAVRAAVAHWESRNAAWNAESLLAISWMPQVTQREFDHLLWACDLNFVRGEDSVVRALWAGKPLVWHIYPQDDQAHHAKLSAFLAWIEAPPAWRDFHWAWNGFAQDMPPLDPDACAATMARARDRLLGQDDLVTQLVRFAAAKGAVP